MPRRASARNQRRDSTPPAQPTSESIKIDEDLVSLRTSWKWAAFSQFFFTFNHLFAMNDVSLNMIEEDLIHGTNIVLPRIMQRLLYTVSYDRKISLDNWQTALRKQYRKRDPAANSIGPEPRVEEVEQPSSPVSERPILPEDMDIENSVEKNEVKPETIINFDEDVDSKAQDSTRASTIERGVSRGTSIKGASVQPSEADSTMLRHSHAASDLTEKEESKNWLDLPTLIKLDSMHLLTEWQFQNPLRLRNLMRSDDENASWRIEPIGYDSKRNAYWLIGADRIWVQRPIPKPTRPKMTGNTKKSLKRKRGSATVPKTTINKQTARTNAAPVGPAAKRPRLQEQDSLNNSTGRSRAAKAQAKMRLDAQAKELAELNREAIASGRSAAGLRTSTRLTSGVSPKKPHPLKPTGIRISARLRGKEDAGEWQAVPDEWLTSGGEANPMQVNRDEIEKSLLPLKTGLESDGSEISDLTELTEGSSGRGGEDGINSESQPEKPVPNTEEPQPTTGEEEHVVTSAPATEGELKEPSMLPEGFVEWETICVTLEEWEHFAERFEKATHYAEKALYKVLVNDVVPIVVEELREIERKQKLSLAITQRKRSSRLLLRQSEKEEAEAVARARREEEERNSRAKRLEARLKKEEAERERRELAREMRRREREERELREKETSDVKEGSRLHPQDDAVVRINDPQAAKQQSKHSSKVGKTTNRLSKGVKNGARTPSGEDWEVDCEICHRRGVNLDDGIPMMSCGICSKWQHIACHDLADRQAGQKRRNWDQVEFLCMRCRNASRTSTAPIPGAGLQTQIHNPYVKSPIGNRYTGSNYPLPAPSTNGILPYTSVQPATPFSTPSRGSIDQPQIFAHSPQQHQPYGGHTSFSQFPPQQRRLSSSMRPSYEPLGYAQPYEYPRAYGLYPQYPPLNGGTQPYQPTSQTRWSLNNTSQPSTSNQALANTSPYNGGATSSVDHDGAIHRGPPMVRLTQTPMNWQPPHHTVSQGVPPHSNASQPGMPFRHYGAAYNSTP